MAPPKTKKLLIFGTGEIGSLARFYFDHDSPYEVVGFTADDTFVSTREFQGLPLVPFSEVKKSFPPGEVDIHVALSYRKLNQVRAERYKAVKATGYQLASYLSSKSVFWNNLSVGENCLILENQTIQPGVDIGSNVMIWSGNHLGHESKIRDHAYISSHVCISGHAEIGAYSFLGVNSAVKDFVKVGNEVFVTMGANVTKDVPDGSVVVGSAGSVYLSDSKAARSLKKKYFGL